MVQDQVIELTERGRDFFSLCFEKFDSDQVNPPVPSPLAHLHVPGYLNILHSAYPCA